MTPVTPAREREELDAIARLIADCRDTARARRLSTLTYHLDMAFVAALAEPDCLASPADGRRVLAAFAEDADRGRTPLDPATIASVIETCHDRAQDLGRSTLAYMLDLARLAVRQAFSD